MISKIKQPYYMISKIKQPYRLLKYCFGKENYINVNTCECINVCKIKNNIYNNFKKPIFYCSSTICKITGLHQKIGDCTCEKICSARQNGVQHYRYY